MKYLIKGKLYEPIKMGDPGDWHQEPYDVCHDCGATYGQYHTEGCDTERCPCCGGQLISCDCGAIYKVKDDIPEEALTDLCKLQIVQTEADNLEIKNYISKNKIKYDSQGSSGNIFFILAKVKLVMEQEGKGELFKEVSERVYTSTSYKEALKIIKEYVHIEDIQDVKEAEAE